MGNRLGLLRLCAALTQALDTGQRATAEVVTNDGEGYELLVQRDDSPWSPGHTWWARGLPYSAACARDRDRHALWPWDERRSDG